MNTNIEELKYLIKELEKETLEPKTIDRINELFFSFEREEKDYDAILVLTSSAIKRVEKAVEVYHQNPCPMILSGGSIFPKDQMIEAERFYIYAITHGVKEKDIILELKSQNTKENLLYSLPLLKDKKKCLLVTSSQHMMRALLTGEEVKKELKMDNPQWIPCPCYATLVPKNNWFKESTAKKIIQGEMERLIKYRLIKE